VLKVCIHRRMMYLRRLALPVSLVVWLFGCSDYDGADDLAAAHEVASELGLTGYVGAIEPILESHQGQESTYTFDPAQGPICMRGAPYRASVRETDSDDLVIFLQGGGACWSAFCLAVTVAPAGVPVVDILDQDLVANPVRDWDTVYLPYCDGSFFAGDVTIDDDLNGKGPRHHRGLANLSGALEVSLLHFPSPGRILLAGSSGGAYGVLLGAALVRHYYPDAELMVMGDSGIGLAREDDRAYLDVILDEFNLRRFLPQECPECVSRGHLIGLVDYLLRRDPQLRFGHFSSWYDTVLSRTFLQVEPAIFAQSLERETDHLRSAHPDRFRRFIVDGFQHTSLLANASGIVGQDISAVELPEGALGRLLGGDLKIGGLESTVIGDVSMGRWLAAFIEHDLEAWSDLVESRGEPPASE